MPANRRASSQDLFVREGLTAIRERLEALLGSEYQISFCTRGHVREAVIKHHDGRWLGQGETTLQALEDAAQQVAVFYGSTADDALDHTETSIEDQHSTAASPTTKASEDVFVTVYVCPDTSWAS